MLMWRVSNRLPRYCFGVKDFFKTLIRRPSRLFQDKPQEDQSFSLRNVESQKPPIPRTTQAAERSIQQTEKQVSSLERRRLKVIDRELGTRTYFYEPQPYQIRLDSEHVMQVKRMKAKAIFDQLKTPRKYDSKFKLDFRVRDRKLFWKNLAKVRQYPQHKKVDFKGQSSASLIEFLAKEVLFSRMSFNSIQHLKSYFLNQDVTPKAHLMYSPKYVYFNIPNTPHLGRVLKTRFPDQVAIKDLPQSDIQVVMSLDQIYNKLLQYDANPFVEQFLKDVENDSLKGTITSSILWTGDQNHLVVVIDLNGQQDQYAVIVKNLITGLVVDVILDVASSVGVMGNRVFFIRRDSLEMLTQLCYLDISNKQTVQVYRELQPKKIRFTADLNSKFLYLYREQISDPWQQKVVIFSFDGENQRVIPVQTESGYQYEFAFMGKGFVYCKYQKNDSLEYPPMFGRTSKRLYLIPLVGNTQVVAREQERQMRRIDQMKHIIEKYNQLSENKIQLKEDARELTLSNQHQIVYQCPDDHAITQMLNMQYELALIVIQSWKVSQYSPSSKLHIIPRKQHSTQTSLLTDHYITFARAQDYHSQRIAFKLRDLTETVVLYTTWSTELEVDRPDSIYSTSLPYECRDGTKQSVTLYSQNIYKDKCLDCVIVFADQKEKEIDFDVIRCLLKKGVLVAIFQGRGSVYGSHQNYSDGAGSKILNSVNDLVDAVLHLHEAGRTQNIALYSKGSHPGHVAALCNIVQPYIFTSTVIHNGSFGFVRQSQHGKAANRGTDTESQQSLDIYRIPFCGREKTSDVIEIQDLDNILISSTTEGNDEARKLVHYIRQGKRKYDQVYYVETGSNREADLTNICYLYRILVDNSKEYNQIRDDYT